MNQKEMSRYLKFITVGSGVLFLIFVGWFFPSIIKNLILKEVGASAFWFTCGFVWITAVPCLLCLWKFWGICVRIGRDESFTRENANALKGMSRYMLVDCVLYTVLLAAACVEGWYVYSIGFMFGIIVILFICIICMIVCAALSHLVYKASQLQDDQNLTI